MRFAFLWRVEDLLGLPWVEETVGKREEVVEVGCVSAAVAEPGRGVRLVRSG